MRNFDEMFRNKVGIEAYCCMSKYSTIDDNAPAECEYAPSIMYDYYEQKRTIYDACKDIGLSNEMSQKDAVKKIASWLCNKITYSASQSVWYTALKTGKGNCSAYAEIMEMICQRVGISCKYVTGNAGGPHAWNIVTLSGQKYYVDVCWMDSNGGNTKYLLSSNLWESHTLD